MKVSSGPVFCRASTYDGLCRSSDMIQSQCQWKAAFFYFLLWPVKPSAFMCTECSKSYKKREQVELSLSSGSVSSHILTFVCSLFLLSMDGGELFSRIQDRGDQAFTERGNKIEHNYSISYTASVFYDAITQHTDSADNQIVIMSVKRSFCPVYFRGIWYHEEHRRGHTIPPCSQHCTQRRQGL